MWLNLRGFATVLDAQTVTQDDSGRNDAVGVGGRVPADRVGAPRASRRARQRRAAHGDDGDLDCGLADRARRGRESPRSPHADCSASSPARPRGRAKVIVLALDGATLDVISPAVAEGRLPNFGRIFDAGAVLHLATLQPTQAEPVWSAVATGRLPVANGIRASALYRVRDGGPALEVLPDYCFA